MMKYSKQQKDELFDKIILRLQAGEAVRNILKDPDMPGTETFYRWIESSKIMSKRYARACEDRAEAIFEEIIEIADDGTNDYMTVKKGDITYNVENKEVVNRSRLRVDARKWIAAKLNPKKYGDKIDITSDNEKVSAPIMTFDPLSPKE